MPQDDSNPHFILASSSPYRAELLKRIQISFETCSPDVDESALPNESSYELANRLAAAKAQKVALLYPQSLVLGCDQVAILQSKDGSNEITLGKPGNFENATKQLASCSGKWVDFYVSCCIYQQSTNTAISFSDRYAIQFRTLKPAAIEHYLHTEKPFNCAGSIKTEGLGITLIATHRGTDPSTLIGLPLIRLIDTLTTHRLYKLPGGV